MTCRFGLLALVWGAIAGCADSSAPTVAPDSASLTAPFVVSNPSHGLLVSSTASGAVVAEAGLVYVSLPPNTVPAAAQATIRVVRTASSVMTPVVDGGFDPVAVSAIAGDVLEVTTLDGNGRPSTPRRLPVPPASPPVIVRTEPAPHKRDVPLNTNLIVVFSEPIDPASLTNASISLQQGGAVMNGTLSFVGALHTEVQFTPAVPLVGGTDYQFNVTTSIRDLDGIALSAAVSVPFSTATLSVAATSPRQNETGVSVRNPGLEVWFNEPIRQATMAAGGEAKLQLRQNGAIMSPLKWVMECRTDSSANCSSLYLASTEVLKWSTRYELLVGAGLVGRSGAVLTHPLTIEFTTADPPTGAPLAELSVASFAMIVYSSSPDKWAYAPKIRLTETGGKSAARLVSAAFTVNGVGAWPKLCNAAFRIERGQSFDLFIDVYGEFGYSLDGPSGPQRPEGLATAVITFTDEDGRSGTISMETRLVPGELPVTAPPGPGQWYGGSC